MNKVEYKGKYVYNWFSNFECIPVTIDGVTYKTMENYFQSQKVIDPSNRLVFENCTPSHAKMLGRKVELRPDWDKIKLSVMEKGLRVKFSKGSDQLKKLLEMDGEIIEWNNWGDRFWGKTLDGVGENHLGKILMKIRDENI